MASLITAVAVAGSAAGSAIGGVAASIGIGTATAAGTTAATAGTTVAAAAGGIGSIGSLEAISAISTAAGTISSISSSAAAASAQDAALHTQTLEMQYKIGKQKGIEEQQLHLQLAKNMMMLGQRGLSSQSPSFNAIQTHEFNNTARSLQNSTVALKINNLSEKAKIDSVHAGLYSSILGTFAGAGQQFANNFAYGYKLRHHIPSKYDDLGGNLGNYSGGGFE